MKAISITYLKHDLSGVGAANLSEKNAYIWTFH